MIYLKSFLSQGFLIEIKNDLELCMAAMRMMKGE